MYKHSIVLAFLGRLAMGYTVQGGYYPGGGVGGNFEVSGGLGREYRKRYTNVGGGDGVAYGGISGVGYEGVPYSPGLGGIGGLGYAGYPVVALQTMGGPVGLRGYSGDYIGDVGSGNYGIGLERGAGNYGHGIHSGAGGYGLGLQRGIGAYDLGMQGGVGGYGMGLEGGIIGGSYRPHVGGGVGLLQPSAGGGYIPHITPIPHHRGIEGQYVDNNGYSGENKNLNNLQYEKADGNQGAVSDHSQEGYNQGKLALKNGKTDNGYYKDVAVGKNVHEDGKNYNGAQHSNQQGKNELENKEQKSHKKGHKIREFKNFHKKDESGNTEEYFDEEHDEGDNFNTKGQAGSYGQNAGSSFNGGHIDGRANNGQRGGQGHYNNEHFANNANAGQGRFGQNKYLKNGQAYGINSGANEEALAGHQSSNGIYKHQPYSHYY